MRKRRLGSTDLHLTTIGLGTWAIGGAGWDFGWGEQDDAESIRAIQRARDLGINWIDTAAVYGFGHSEEIVGKAIRGRRDEWIVATKCGLVRERSSPTPHPRLDRASVRAEAEASLRRLGVERIDLYQIHWPNPDEKIEEAWETIARLVQEGKVRHAGVSNFQVEHLDRVRRIHPVASLQPPYSMIARGVEQELLAYCAEQGIGIVAYSPMAVGLLTGTMTRTRIADLPEDDWRRKAKNFQEPRLTANLDLVDRLRPIAEELDRPLGQLAISWVLRLEEVTSAIVGARRPSQIEDLAAAADWRIPEPDLERIEAALSEHARAVAS